MPFTYLPEYDDPFNALSLQLVYRNNFLHLPIHEAIELSLLLEYQPVNQDRQKYRIIICHLADEFKKHKHAKTLPHKTTPLSSLKASRKLETHSFEVDLDTRNLGCIFSYLAVFKLTLGPEYAREIYKTVDMLTTDNDKFALNYIDFKHEKPRVYCTF